MGRTGASLFLAILVVAALSAGYLAVSSGRQSSTSTSTSSVEEPTSTTTSAVFPSGLELRVGLNATAMLPGQTLAANVALFNTLNENLSLPLSAPANLTSQIAAWNNDDFWCGTGGLASYVAGFALFRGHVSADNLSLAPDPLQLDAVLQAPCNGFYAGQEKSIVFLPHSEDASIPGFPIVWPASLNVTTSCYQACSRGSGLFGYWNRTSYACCAADANAPNLFRYFTPGEYTMAAEDLWGDRVFAYFQVAQSPGPSMAVSAQESPFSSEGHPIIGITLADFADAPITSLNATLRLVASSSSTSYQFAFSVNSSDPLLPGQQVQDVTTLQGSPFDIGVGYPLTISGTLANGTEFAYTQQIQFVNSVPS
jgi:hypothetical protein